MKKYWMTQDFCTVHKCLWQGALLCARVTQLWWSIFNVKMIQSFSPGNRCFVVTHANRRTLSVCVCLWCHEDKVPPLSLVASHSKKTLKKSQSKILNTSNQLLNCLMFFFPLWNQNRCFSYGSLSSLCLWIFKISDIFVASLSFLSFPLFLFQSAAETNPVSDIDWHYDGKELLILFIIFFFFFCWQITFHESVPVGIYGLFALSGISSKYVYLS